MAEVTMVLIPESELHWTVLFYKKERGMAPVPLYEATGTQLDDVATTVASGYADVKTAYPTLGLM